MGDFRIPHPFENIGDAIKDAVNAAVNTATPTGATDVVTQLMNENNRAIEDAIDGGTTRGAILADEETGVPSNTPVSFQWVFPGRSQNVFSGFVTAETSIPAGQTLYMVLQGTEYSTVSTGSGACAVTAGITALVDTGDVTADIDVRWETGGGTATLSVAGSGVYIAG